MKKTAYYIAGCVIAVGSLLLSTFLIAFFSGDPVDYNYGVFSWLIVILLGLAFGHFYSKDKNSK